MAVVALLLVTLLVAVAAGGVAPLLQETGELGDEDDSMELPAELIGVVLTERYRAALLTTAPPGMVPRMGVGG